jgi:hypothetical protein
MGTIMDFVDRKYELDVKKNSGEFINNNRAYWV